MRTAAVPAVVLALAFSWVSIAQVNPRMVVANIDFDFHLGKEVLPAGTYNFNLGDKAGIMTVTNAKSGKSYMASILTRISQAPGDIDRVVFDKMGDQYYLSELHSPGTDGFHFTGAPGPHSHVSLKAGK